MVSNLNTMICATREPVENHLLVLKLGGVIWMPGLPSATESTYNICRHRWRLSMDGRVVDAEPEDKVWSGYRHAWGTCTLPWVPTLGTLVQLWSSGSGLQATRQERPAREGPG